MTFANPEPTVDQLFAYLQNNKLIIGSQTLDGYSQVYYVYNDQKIFVTKGNTNHAASKVSGQYITWISPNDGPEQQVYLYDALNKVTLRLSSYGTNAAVAMSGSRVVWSKWVDERWQLFYYNGFESVPITTLDGSASRVRMKNNIIVYTQYVPDDPDGTPWHVKSYDTNTDSTDLVHKTANGTDAYPYFDANGDIQTQYSLEYLSSN